MHAQSGFAAHFAGIGLHPTTRADPSASEHVPSKMSPVPPPKQKFAAPASAQPHVLHAATGAYPSGASRTYASAYAASDAPASLGGGGGSGWVAVDVAVG